VARERSSPMVAIAAVLEAFAVTSWVAHTDKLAGPKLYSTSPPRAKTWNLWV
jgi:hypothetical protein